MISSSSLLYSESSSELVYSDDSVSDETDGRGLFDAEPVAEVVLKRSVLVRPPD